jgi:hypothetical protein
MPLAVELLGKGCGQLLVLYAPGDKGPKRRGWPEYVVTDDEALAWRGNVGLKNGPLLSVDIDLHGEPAVEASRTSARARSIAGRLRPGPS